ncbi:conserved hypothetical protein [Roseibium sp. TrichSKD4]|nr:conserved hypothetical protein [Roseibium sp. TrichSKD4]
MNSFNFLLLIANYAKQAKNFESTLENTLNLWSPPKNNRTKENSCFLQVLVSQL